jgi:hypothetical protein
MIQHRTKANMMRSRAVFANAAAAAALLLAAPAWAQPPSNVKSITTTLTSAAARKECVNLTPQQRLHYWYRADSAVNFNIQYVQGKETLYPVKKDKLAIGSGSFQPKVAEVYCLVWTNLARQPVTLSFEFGRLGGG